MLWPNWFAGCAILDLLSSTRTTQSSGRANDENKHGETGARKRAEGKLEERPLSQRPLGSHYFHSLGWSLIAYLLARSIIQSGTASSLLACVAGVNGEEEGHEKGEGRREGTLALTTGLFALRPPISWSSNNVICQYVSQSETGARFYALLTSCGNLLCSPRPSANQPIGILWPLAFARNEQKGGVCCRHHFSLSDTSSPLRDTRYAAWQSNKYSNTCLCFC